MPKKFFFIIFVLFINSFDVAKSEEFVSYCPAVSKEEFIKGSEGYDCSSDIMSSEETKSVELVRPLNIEFDKIEKINIPVQNISDESFDLNRIQLAAASTTATLGIFSPLLTKVEKGGIWFRPYSTFENIPLNNGPTVKSISYGALVGIDSDLKNLKKKWQRVNSGYLGYTGSRQSYNSVKQTQLSGFSGFYSTFYRNNFFSAVVLTAGGNVVKSNDSQDIVAVHAGLITRTGYNLKFPHHLVFQPNYIMSYTFDNTFDYRNNRGELVEESPLNIIHIVPSVRFFAELKDGWQPFFIVNMAFNILCSGDVTVNYAALPMTSVKPYVEYGGGVQKLSKGKFSTFIQVLAKSGGRNGVSILAGFRWAFNK